MTRATKDANDRERNRTNGEHRFLRNSLCRSIPLLDRAAHVKLAQKLHAKEKLKKNLKCYLRCAPRIKHSHGQPRTSTLNKPGKAIFGVRKSDIEKYGTQTPLKVYAKLRGQRTSEELVEEKIQIHVKEFTREQKGD